MTVARNNFLKKKRSGIVKHMNCGGRYLKRTVWGILTALLILAQSAWADTTVSGAISVDTSWDLAGSPYIVNGTLAIQGADGADGVTTLTLEPGVEVRFV
jgi:hypothetical protein